MTFTMHTFLVVVRRFLAAGTAVHLFVTLAAGTAVHSFVTLAAGTAVHSFVTLHARRSPSSLTSDSSACPRPSHPHRRLRRGKPWPVHPIGSTCRELHFLLYPNPYPCSCPLTCCLRGLGLGLGLGAGLGLGLGSGLGLGLGLGLG